MTDYSQKVVFKTSSGNEIVLDVPLRTDLEIKPTSELNLFQEEHPAGKNSLFTIKLSYIIDGIRRTDEIENVIEYTTKIQPNPTQVPGFDPSPMIGPVQNPDITIQETSSLEAAEALLGLNSPDFKGRPMVIGLDERECTQDKDILDLIKFVIDISSPIDLTSPSWSIIDENDPLLRESFQQKLDVYTDSVVLLLGKYPYYVINNGSDDGVVLLLRMEKKGNTWKLEQERTLLSHGHIWIAVNDFLTTQKIVLGGSRVTLLNQTGDPDKAEWIINKEPENFSNSGENEGDSFDYIDDSHLSNKRRRTSPPDDHSRFGFSEFHFSEFPKLLSEVGNQNQWLMENVSESTWIDNGTELFETYQKHLESKGRHPFAINDIIQGKIPCFEGKEIFSNYNSKESYFQALQYVVDNAYWIHNKDVGHKNLQLEGFDTRAQKVYDKFVKKINNGKALSKEIKKLI